MDPRPAATVVVARPAQGPAADPPREPAELAGVEVLLLRRSAVSRFAPGYVVFPGGVVDPSDDHLAAEWFGDPSEAVRACAVRELAEEAGLVLTAEGLRPLAPGESIARAVGQAPPTAGALPEMAKWRAPEVLAVRFDACFYAIAASAGTEAIPDMVEVDLAWWERPGDALARHPLWTALLWPTYRTLEALAECATVDDVLRLRVPQEPPPESLLAGYTPPAYRSSS